MSPPTDASNRSAAWDLEVRHPDGSVMLLSMDQSPLNIGRSRNSHVRLPSDRISRNHAQLVRDRQGQWWIRDLHSRNGVKLNGKNIVEHRVRPGDQIEISRYVLVIKSAQNAASARDCESRMIIADDAGTHISQMGEKTEARISMDHLKAIKLLESQLTAAPDIEQRANVLCWFMVGSPFHGLGALVLRIPEGGTSVKLVNDPTTDPRRLKKFPPVSRSLIKAVVKHRSTVLAGSESRAERMLELSRVSDSEAYSAIAAPIHSDSEGLWILYLVIPAAYGNVEWMTLVTLAAQQFQSVESFMAAARNAEQQAAIEQDLNRAREIQMRLIPDGSQIDSAEAVVSFEPCKTVGGDYADVLQLPDGRVAMVIADVCGKGLPAALVTATLHSMLHTLLIQGRDLAGVIGDINTYLINHVGHHRFVTLCLGILDPQTGRLEFMNAGHPSALMIKPDGRHLQIPDGSNMPLGIQSQTFEIQRSQLEPGDVLMLFTDGLAEMVGPNGRQLTTAGLTRAVSQRYAAQFEQPLRELSGEIQDYLREYQKESESMDDRTFLLLRRKS